MPTTRVVLTIVPSVGIGPNTSTRCSPCTSIAQLMSPKLGMPPPPAIPTITGNVGSASCFTSWLFSVVNSSSKPGRVGLARAHAERVEQTVLVVPRPFARRRDRTNGIKVHRHVLRYSPSYSNMPAFGRASATNFGTTSVSLLGSQRNPLFSAVGPRCQPSATPMRSPATRNTRPGDVFRLVRAEPHDERRDVRRVERVEFALPAPRPCRGSRSCACARPVRSRSR